MTRPRRAHRSNSKQRQRAEAISQSPSSATRAKNSGMQQTPRTVDYPRIKAKKPQIFFPKKKGEKKKKKTLGIAHYKNTDLTQHAKEREKTRSKTGANSLLSSSSVFPFLLLSTARVQCAFVFLSFLFPRAAKCKSLSLSLSPSPSLPPGALFTPGANGLRGQAWLQPMGKRDD